MILRVVHLIGLLAFLLPIPFFLYLESTWNYYKDYVSYTAGLDGAESEVYDFIIGESELL